jgi:hypothetical protein
MHRGSRWPRCSMSSCTPAREATRRIEPLHPNLHGEWVDSFIGSKKEAAGQRVCLEKNESVRWIKDEQYWGLMQMGLTWSFVHGGRWGDESDALDVGADAWGSFYCTSHGGVETPPCRVDPDRRQGVQLAPARCQGVQLAPARCQGVQLAPAMAVTSICRLLRWPAGTGVSGVRGTVTTEPAELEPNRQRIRNHDLIKVGGTVGEKNLEKTGRQTPGHWLCWCVELAWYIYIYMCIYVCVCIYVYIHVYTVLL